MPKPENTGNPSKILYCSCKHDYQDKKYGQGRRMHNFCRKANDYRCTVCGATKK